MGAVFSELTIADAFFNRQDSVKAIEAQRGRAYFSYSPSVYVRIADDPNDARAIYLWAFDRMRNVSNTNASLVEIFDRKDEGTGKAMLPYRRIR
jgi:hypothetical protein